MRLTQRHLLASALISLTVSLAMAASSNAFAQTKLDSASDDALQKTKQLLVNPEQRAQAIKGDAKAQEADARAKAAAGGSAANTQQIYNISADVFDKIARDSGGDSSKMSERLSQGQADPEAFFKSLSPEQRQAIENLARDIEIRQAHGGQPR